MSEWLWGIFPKGDTFHWITETTTIARSFEHQVSTSGTVKLNAFFLFSFVLTFATHPVDLNSFSVCLGFSIPEGPEGHTLNWSSYLKWSVWKSVSEVVPRAGTSVRAQSSCTWKRVLHLWSSEGEEELSDMDRFKLLSIENNSPISIVLSFNVQSPKTRGRINWPNDKGLFCCDRTD